MSGPQMMCVSVVMSIMLHKVHVTESLDVILHCGIQMSDTNS